jgi:hypothetical protein
VDSARPRHGIRATRNARDQPPPEKCTVNARANAPKPPRVTPAGPESDGAAADPRPDEESPLKKLLRA